MAVASEPGWLKSHWPYLLGAVLVHVFIAGLFSLNLVNWQRNASPPTLAIQAIVIDQNQLEQAQRRPQQDRERALREAEARAAEERRKQEAEAARREQEQRAEQERLEAERREQERVRQEQLVRERQEQERIAKEKAAEEQRALERKRQEEAERQRKLEAERQAKLEAERKAKAEAERKRVEEIQRKQREREEAERRRIAEENAARERALREQLAEEEGRNQLRASGAMSQYVGMIQQHVERQWIRPPSARPGIECEVNVTQSQTGTVLRVQVGACNGDQAVRQSIENAVQRASPLPLPSDMRLFDRNLRFIFKPAD